MLDLPWRSATLAPYRAWMGALILQWKSFCTRLRINFRRALLVVAVIIICTGLPAAALYFAYKFRHGYILFWKACFAGSSSR
jgi:ABC-type cobalamin transport system permease subunit